MRPLRTLVAGHVTHDRFPGRLRAGGALYCARVHQTLGAQTFGAQTLGAQTRLITAVGTDFACRDELESLDWEAQVGERTTCFVNVYPDVGPRVQHIEASAPAVLPPAAVPPLRAEQVAGAGADPTGDWDVLHLAPVIGEIDLALWKRSVRARMVGINVQGWLRAAVTAPGHSASSIREIRPKRWDPDPELLSGIHVACLSEEDLEGQGDLVTRLARVIPIVALTRGARGCELFLSGARVQLGAAEARCVDPTGAGDSFAAALLHRVALGCDPVDAARLASAVAAVVIAAEATSGIAKIAKS
jgi:sugar/nucleoside kinase (ribokinase family)